MLSTRGMPALRRSGAGALALLAVCLSAAAAPALSQDDGAAILARIKAYHGELKDMTAEMKVEHENNAALSRISPDFAEFVKYGFRTLKYTYKSPDKVRMESSATLFHFLRGISTRNGGQKNFYVPTFGVHKQADVTGEANKKETSLDFGIMTGDIWDDYNVWYMRTEGQNPNRVYVLGLKPKNEPHGGTMIVRLDANTLKVLERDRYNMDGVVQQRQYFSNFAHPLPHVWIPTLIKLYNNLGQFGGDLVYSKVAVNTGVSDNLFH